ncbi:hypothetical protein THRCLA_22645, partial [Thraustotheca clavata]
TRNNNCGATVGDGTHSLFKHTASDEANLLEFSVAGGKVWYDMSNIPPGPDHCTSYADCKAHTGKKGYNVPVDVIPTRHNNGQNCRKLHDTKPDAPDAYLFPGDVKTPW